MKSNLPIFESKVSQSIDTALKTYIDALFKDRTSDLRDIFYYHLGLADNASRKGKRIRPVLTALCTEGAGEDWGKSIPAACAIELVHNFSLIHDDIEDNSAKRRGEESVWKKWGLAKGINSGDAMYSAALSVLGENETLDEATTLSCLNLLSHTCLALTEGQELDIHYEDKKEISIEEYFRMVKGKTSALIACCTQIGALIGGLNEEEQENYRLFGEHLGIAFQIVDDWLGVWGEPHVTGKSASSDLLEEKKSFPVVLGFQYSTRFTMMWHSEPVEPHDIADLVHQLDVDGIKSRVEEEFKKWTHQALKDLEMINCREAIKNLLKEFTNKLLIRKN